MSQASAYSARTPDEYLRTRLDYKTDAYTRKGDRYRRLHLSGASIAAVSAAAVPVLINWEEVPTVLPTLLSLLVTILVTLEGVFHFREHWKNYDLMKSFLRQEACLYQAGAGPYHRKAGEEAFVLLVERVEDAIAKERAQTIEMRTSGRAEGGSGKNGSPDDRK
ncbi:MAG: DUF4231 domain-containing protein [Myxococcota bacterium]|jgi:Protein of unknown function (DUF4231)|nr:DUF4231 domain-containing protein [Myxococcota bacterium]